MAGGKALADGIGQVGNAFSSAIADTIGNREKSVALDASMSIIQQQAPNLLPPEFMEKFHGAGVSAKAGMMTTALAMLNRQDQQAAQGKDFSLKVAQAGNSAAYHQGMLDNMSADNARQAAKADWEMAPDNQQPVTMDLPDATAYGVTGEKSGTRIFNFIPKPKAAAQPGMVRGADGIGYYAGPDGKPVNPSYLLADPVAGAPRGNEMPLGSDLLPMPGDGTASDGLPVGPPLPGRPERLFPGAAAKDFVDRPYPTAVQNPDGTFTEKRTILRTYNDGRILLLQPPNDANEAAGQIPEFKTIVPMRGQAPASPAGPAKPAPAAPAAAVPFWKR